MLISSSVLVTIFLSIALYGFSFAEAAYHANESIMIANSGDIAAAGFPGQRKIAFDKDKNMYVAYRSKIDGKLQIFVTKFSAAGNYAESSKTTFQVSNAKVTQRVPSIAIDSKNIIHITWYGADSKNKINERQVKYAKSNDGGKTWSEAKNIAYVKGYKKDEYWQEHPSVYIGQGDEIFIVWEGKDAKNAKQQVKFVKSTDSGNSWGNWINIGTTKDKTQSRPSLVQDNSGKLHLVMYSSYGGKGQQIQYSTSGDKGNSWSAWQNISNSKFDSRHPSLAIGGNGALHAVWRAPNKANGPAQMYYSNMSSGKWSAPVVATASKNYQFFPNICVDGSGKVYAVWMETKSKSDFPKEKPVTGKIYISYLEDGGKFSAPKEVSYSGESFYPNMPLSMSEMNFVPVLYSSNAKLGQIMLGKAYK